MTILVENLSFRYKTLGADPGNVLQDVNLKINSGEFLALIGSSGSGKTTLMQHFTGLLKPDQGCVVIDGEDLWHDKVSLTRIRRKIGLVFQFPETQLFEETVFSDVAFGPRNLGLSESEVETRVRDAIRAVAVDFDTFRDRSPIHLSEGEKRRVAIAGVLAMEPACLILDEPTAGLDQSGVEAVVNALRAYHAKGRTVILISHNLDLVATVVERVVVLKEGGVLFDGPQAELFGDAGLLRSCELPAPRIVAVANVLRNMGLVKSGGISTLEELKELLAKSCRSKKEVDLS